MNDCIRHVEETRSTGGEQIQTSVCRLVCKIKIKSKCIPSHLISDLKQVARQAKQSTRSGSLDSEAKRTNGLLLATSRRGRPDTLSVQKMHRVGLCFSKAQRWIRYPVRYLITWHDMISCSSAAIPHPKNTPLQFQLPTSCHFLPRHVHFTLPMPSPILPLHLPSFPSPSTHPPSPLAPSETQAHTYSLSAGPQTRPKAPCPPQGYL